MAYYIYRITNLINGKTYIGKHKYKKLNDNYMGSGVALGRSQKKYGIENFKKDILVFNIPREEQAFILEKTFIASEREKVGIENCYNISNGGDGVSGMEPWNKGKKMSEEFKRKDSEAHKGKPSSRKGVHLSEDEKLIISIKTKEAMTEEVKKKISEKKKGKPSPRKGKPMSEEAKRKSSESHKGQVAWNKGIPMSEEQKKKLSDAHKGKKSKIMEEMMEAYKKSGRKDWNAFQKEYRKGDR